MARFVIFEPADALGGDAAMQARFVRDGFSLVGFLVPPLWLLWHGLVIEAVLAFAALLGLGALAEMLGLGLAGSVLSLLVSVYVGLEGPALRIAALRRRGWAEWGAVDADTAADAEIRYAVAVGEDDTRDGEIVPAMARSSSAPTPRHAAGPALGLLNYPGRA